jgi:hypothetical protein
MVATLAELDTAVTSHRIDLDDNDMLDDVVFEEVDRVHIERMSPAHVWMQIDTSAGVSYRCGFSTTCGGGLLWLMDVDS